MAAGHRDQNVRSAAALIIAIQYIVSPCDLKPYGMKCCARKGMADIKGHKET